LGGKYAKPETPGLTAHVEKGTKELEPFALTISAAQAKRNEAVNAQWQRKKGKNR
jgi:hypothetical protein